MSCHFQQYLHSLRPLCIQADSSFVSFHTFWLDVAEQAAQIQPLEQPVWALWQEDSYEFLVLLFAALQAGKQVLLPPHRVSDLEKELAEQQIYFLKRLPSTAESTFELQFDAAFFNQAQLYFYTSGSTGQPKKIPRTLQQLFNENPNLGKSHRHKIH